MKLCINLHYNSHGHSHRNCAHKLSDFRVCVVVLVLSVAQFGEIVYVSEEVGAFVLRDQIEC